MVIEIRILIRDLGGFGGINDDVWRMLIYLVSVVKAVGQVEFGKVVDVGSVWWSLHRIGSILGTGRSHTRFCEGIPQRGVEKICRAAYFVNPPKNGFENFVVLKYWLVSRIYPGKGFDFCFWMGYFLNLKQGF